MLEQVVRYFHSPEFRTGLFGTVISFLFNALILSVFVPIAAWILRRRRTSRLRFSLGFYYLQVFHSLVDAYLNLAGIRDPSERLEALFRQKKIDTLRNSTVYGDLEGRLWLLCGALRSGELRRELCKRTPAELKASEEMCRKSVAEIDTLAAFVAASPKLFDMMMSLRIMAYGSRDAIASLRAAPTSVHRQHAVVAGLTDTVPVLGRLFDLERRKIDRQVRRRLLLDPVKMLFSVILWRFKKETRRVVETVRTGHGRRTKPINSDSNYNVSPFVLAMTAAGADDLAIYMMLLSQGMTEDAAKAEIQRKNEAFCRVTEEYEMPPAHLNSVTPLAILARGSSKSREGAAAAASGGTDRRGTDRVP